MDLAKVFFQECKARYAPLGFRRGRQAHARIVNDVMQTFTFQRFRTGCDCTVYFGVFPLCQGLKYPDLGIRFLRNFELPTYSNDWKYDRDSEESINACVQDICGYIDRYLIPLFTEANCSEKALPALIRLDAYFYNVRNNVRKMYFQQSGKVDRPVSDWSTYFYNVRKMHYQQKGEADRSTTDWITWADNEKFYMALKCGQYDFAREAARGLIPTSRPEYAQLYRSLIEQLDAGNIEHVKDILFEREQESLKKLKEFRLTPITSFETKTDKP